MFPFIRELKQSDPWRCVWIIERIVILANVYLRSLPGKELLELKYCLITVLFEVVNFLAIEVGTGVLTYGHLMSGHHVSGLTSDAKHCALSLFKDWFQGTIFECQLKLT